MENIEKSFVLRHDSCADDVSLEDSFYPNDQEHMLDKTQPNSAKHSKEDSFASRSTAASLNTTELTQKPIGCGGKCRPLYPQQQQDVLLLTKDIQEDLGTKNTTENVKSFNLLDNTDASSKVKSAKQKTEDVPHSDYCQVLGVKIFKQPLTFRETNEEDVTQEYGRKVKDVTFQRSESIGVDVGEGREHFKSVVSGGAPSRGLGLGDLLSARSLCALALVILTLALAHQHTRISMLEETLVKLTDMKQFQAAQVSV